MDTMRLMDKALDIAAKKGIKQADLARMIGAPPSRLSEWKDDKGRPSIEKALLMARVLGVDLEYLADDAMDEPSPPSELPVDEETILTVYRALKISRDEAIKRLATPEGGKTYIAEPASMTIRETTEHVLRQARAANQPKKKSSGGHGDKNPLGVNKGSTSS